MCIALCQVQYILKCGIQFKDGTEMNETLEKGRDDGWGEWNFCSTGCEFKTQRSKEGL